MGYPGGPVSNARCRSGRRIPTTRTSARAARLRYLAVDIGPRISNSDSDFYRVLAGLKGTAAEWDYDTAFLYSETKGQTSRTGYLQRDVDLRAPGTRRAANVAAATRRQRRLRRVAAGHPVAHRRERRPQLGRAVCGAVADDHRRLHVEDHPDRRQGLARDRQARQAGRSASPSAPSCAARAISLTPDDRNRARQRHRPRLLGLRRRRTVERRLRRGARAGAEAARGRRPRSATTTTPTPATRRRPRSASSTRRSASWRCAAPTRRAFARRARPRTAVGGLAAFSTASRSGALRASASRRRARRRAVAVITSPNPDAEAGEVGQLHARPGVRADVEDEHRHRLLRHHDARTRSTRSRPTRRSPPATSRAIRRRRRPCPATPARSSRCSASTSTRRGPKCAASTSTPSRASTSAAASAS